MEKITKKDFLEAEKVAYKYKLQTNEELVSSYTCICCKVNKINPNGISSPDVLEQDKGTWDDGSVHKISFGYGSKHDSSSFFIAICDDCIENATKEGLAFDIDTLQQKVNPFYTDDFFLDK